MSTTQLLDIDAVSLSVAQARIPEIRPIGSQAAEARTRARDREQKRAGSVELKALIARVGQRDAEALSHLYDRTSRLVFSIALRILWQREEAEETTHDVYTQVWNQAASYDARRGAVEAWLVTLARTRAIDRLRARSARQEMNAVPLAFAEPRSAAPHQEDPAAMIDARVRVGQALASLAEAERRLIELAFFAGYSHRELAERLHVPLGTVKTRIRTGLLKMRRVLDSPQHVVAEGGPRRRHTE